MFSRFRLNEVPEDNVKLIPHELRKLEERVIMGARIAIASFCVHADDINIKYENPTMPPGENIRFVVDQLNKLPASSWPAGTLCIMAYWLRKHESVKNADAYISQHRFLFTSTDVNDARLAVHMKEYGEWNSALLRGIKAERTDVVMLHLGGAWLGKVPPVGEGKIDWDKKDYHPTFKFFLEKMTTRPNERALIRMRRGLKEVNQDYNVEVYRELREHPHVYSKGFFYIPYEYMWEERAQTERTPRWGSNEDHQVYSYRGLGSAPARRSSSARRGRFTEQREVVVESARWRREEVERGTHRPSDHFAMGRLLVCENEQKPLVERFACSMALLDYHAVAVDEDQPRPYYFEARSICDSCFAAIESCPAPCCAIFQQRH